MFKHLHFCKTWTKPLHACLRPTTFINDLEIQLLLKSNKPLSRQLKYVQVWTSSIRITNGGIIQSQQSKDLTAHWSQHDSEITDVIQYSAALDLSGYAISYQKLQKPRVCYKNQTPHSVVKLHIGSHVQKQHLFGRRKKYSIVPVVSQSVQICRSYYTGSPFHNSGSEAEKWKQGTQPEM